MASRALSATFNNLRVAAESTGIRSTPQHLASFEQALQVGRIRSLEEQQKSQRGQEPKEDKKENDSTDKLNEEHSTHQRLNPFS
ncbi:hypothetical protein BS50DRAFT_676597 [Corynespora cassiicola Philippines]|uniref:Uncharacterized protein n=1 Tax=Corynespora cassiicola Philippines TaxID=1448308 RepID=A0A2T2NNS2_CORCC|nr:hypothetical protein BS50DRAFT_676597 [Corynespora cassiicola Philippines]